MSGLSSASSSTSSATAPGTNVAPISFPGIASGIDYNSIIQKYTDITLQQETPLKTQVTALNAQQPREETLCGQWLRMPLPGLTGHQF